MAKIGFFIQSSNQELFVNNTRILKEFYLDVISKNNLDIDVFSFVGNTNVNSMYDNDNTTLVFDCDDRVVLKKYKCLFEYLKNKDYEYILITNNSTLVNLVNLNAFISTSIDDDIYYGTITIRTPELFEYVNGNVKLFSKKILDKITFPFAEIEHVNYYITFLHSAKSTNQWIGLPEDLVIQIVLNILNIKHVLLYEYLMFNNYFFGAAEEPLVFDNIFFICFRLPDKKVFYNDMDKTKEISYNNRLHKETELLKSIIEQIKNNKSVICY